MPWNTSALGDPVRLLSVGSQAALKERLNKVMGGVILD